MASDKMVVRAVVIKVDPVTLKSIKYPIFIPKKSEEKMLEHALKALNVGDFLILGDKKFRRVKGGFREASDQDMAELVGSQLHLENHSNSNIYMPKPFEILCRCTLKKAYKSALVYYDDSGKVVATRGPWTHDKGENQTCSEEVRAFEISDDEKEKLIDETLRKMFNVCLQKESFDPQILYSPTQPMHEHAPIKRMHPIFQRHRA